MLRASRAIDTFVQSRHCDASGAISRAMNEIVLIAQGEEVQPVASWWNHRPAGARPGSP